MTRNSGQIVAMGDGPKCKRHSWCWIPRMDATFDSPRTGCTIAFDLGYCRKCGAYTSRIHVWTPGEVLDAQLWGMQRFEGIKRMEGAE